MPVVKSAARWVLGAQHGDDGAIKTGGLTLDGFDADLFMQMVCRFSLLFLFLRAAQQDGGNANQYNGGKTVTVHTASLSFEFGDENEAFVKMLRIVAAGEFCKNFDML